MFLLLPKLLYCWSSWVMPDLTLKIMLTGAAHNGQVCSTWGNFHFYTFDGDFFQLPYGCNYVLATMCDSTQSDFNIQMRRQYIDDLPEITSFTIKLEGVVISLHHGNTTVNDKKWVFSSCWKCLCLYLPVSYPPYLFFFFLWCLKFSQTFLNRLIIPGYYSGIRIEKITNYIKISSKLGVTLFWDEDNSFAVQFDFHFSYSISKKAW